MSRISCLLLLNVTVVSAVEFERTSILRAIEVKTTDQIAGFTAADFNGDFYPDLAVLLRGAKSAQVALLYGDGKRSFTVGPTVPVCSYENPSSNFMIQAADFNRDRRADLAIVCPDGVSLHLGNGQGSFRRDGHYSTRGWGRIFVADVTGEGVADIIYQLQGGSASAVLLPTDGTGTFLSAVTLSVRDVQVVGDVNGDGRADLVSAGFGLIGFSVWLADGRGGFRSTFTTNQPPNAGVLSFAIGDFNGDRRPDVYYSGSIFSGRGDGTFTYSMDGVFMFPMLIADLNNDERTDIIAGALHDNATYVWLSRLGDQFEQMACPDCVASPRYITVDLDLNGLPEIIDVNYLGQVTVLRPVQETLRCDAGAACGNLFQAAVTGDFTGDGTPDLLLAGDRQLRLLRGDGQGGFQMVRQMVRWSESSSLAAADFNGDGRLDFVVRSIVWGEYWQYTHLSVFLNQPDGSFRAAEDGPDLYDDYDYASMSVTDVNRDGRPDVVLSGFVSGGPDVFGHWRILLNKGDGTLDPVKLELPVRHVAPAGDFNNDGRADLAAVTQAGLELLEGTADGKFRTARLISPGKIDSYLYTDLDRDGHADFVVSASDRVLILTGPVFGPKQELRGAKGPLAIVNANGVPNLISGRWLYPGRGDGTFGEPEELYPEAENWTVANVADVSGDSRDDLIVTSGGNVSLLVQR